MMRECDVLIIGAGMSGLAAGIRLAHFGKKVCIAERHSRIGGLNSWYSRQGITLETGLHAMTNFMPSGGSKHAPLMKMLRQLRIPYADLALRPQRHSLIHFPSAQLRFSNDFGLLVSEIAVRFPKEVDGFIRLDADIRRYDDVRLLPTGFLSAREHVGRYLSDPLLIDMLFCPLSFYGSATEKDMNFRQFVTMYKAVFAEGFCRPAVGITGLLSLIEHRFLESGGEFAMQTGISHINVHDGHVCGAVTDRGEVIRCKQILSCAGYNETLALIPDICPPRAPGAMGYCETIYLADETVIDSGGTDETIRFFSETDTFCYAAPQAAVDTSSGVVCYPRRFAFESGDMLPPSAVRLTSLANPSAWIGLDPTVYCARKTDAAQQIATAAVRQSGIQHLSARAEMTDFFTPHTIFRYTGHQNGAVYGTAEKQYDGCFPVGELYLCGTDQGFLGIVGAMLSGISIANSHLLK